MAALSLPLLGLNGNPKSKKSYLAALIPNERGRRRSNGFTADRRRHDVGEWNVRWDWANRLARVEFGAGPCPRRVRLDGLGRRHSADLRPFVRCGSRRRNHSGDHFHWPSLLETPALDLSDRRRRELLARDHRAPHRPYRRPRESARWSGLRQRGAGDVVNPFGLARRNYRLPSWTENIAAEDAGRRDLRPPGLRRHCSRGGLP